MIKIGICGVGFVGTAIYTYFINRYIKYNHPNTINSYQHYVVIKYDKYKNINTLHDLLETNIIYLCLPTNYCEKLKTYDMTEIDNTIFLLNEYKYKGIILIKSTVIPTYCDMINDKYPNLCIMHNPEFLSAKTAIEDFANQHHIIIGTTKYSEDSIHTKYIYDFYRIAFPVVIISIVSSSSSSLVKLACNSFYATKIQFFTEIYLLCDKLKIPYNLIKSLMLMNNWINPMHTNVPGHDNLLSFGGACLPKDINSLNQFMITYNSMNTVIDSVIKERNIIRKTTKTRRNSI